MFQIFKYGFFKNVCCSCALTQSRVYATYVGDKELNDIKVFVVGTYRECSVYFFFFLSVFPNLWV